MDAMEAILSRRSIRKYTSDPVDDETVAKLLEAAMAAPTAANQQSWRFVVIKDRALLEKIPDVHPYSSMTPGAAVVIAVCGETEDTKHPGYWVQDCAAATQNLLLAAHALGLGAVWLGVHPREERSEGIRALLGLPKHVAPLSLVAIGHPAEAKPPAGRFDPAKVHLERW